MYKSFIYSYIWMRIHAHNYQCEYILDIPGGLYEYTWPLIIPPSYSGRSVYLATDNTTFIFTDNTASIFREVCILGD